ncbi:immunoglobulin-like domain-containing protein [Listeria grandensis]|uniref:immunoglobulin-like domain-containing protein n=1 Tax=Listeria grandensis TaxID=1494963 RepID=UPI00164DA273
MKNRSIKLAMSTMLVLQAFLIALVGVFYVPQTEQVSAVEEKATTAKYRNVMYYGDWSIWGGQDNFYPKDIPADQLTHLNFAFVDFDSNGNFQFTDTDAAINSGVGETDVPWAGPTSGILNTLQSLRADNPNMKIGVSLGGWSKSGDFSVVAADPVKRANFVSNAMKFIKYTNMDFVDVDWEYPASVRAPDNVDNKNDEGTPNSRPEDKENYIKLLQELRTALDKQGSELKKTYELTVALPAPKSKLDEGIDVKALFNIVDFANIMTYDMHGAWEGQSNHHSALYGNPNNPDYANGLSVDQTVNYLTSKGAASEKIVIGAAYYSRGWNTVEKGNNPLQPGLFQPAAKDFADSDGSPTWGTVNEIDMVIGDFGRASGTWAYRNIDKLKASVPGLKEYWDDVAKAPYLYSEVTGQFFTFDNVRSVTEKANYVKNKNLGGMISWMQSQDKVSPGSTKRDELTKAIKVGLEGTEKLPDQKIVYANQDVEVTLGTSANAYTVNIRNKATAKETSPVLKAVESAFNTIKLPKFYISLNTNERLSAGDNHAGSVSQTGNIATVDLSSVYDGKTILPGGSYTFKLTTTGTAKQTNVDTIHLTQRMTTHRSELGKQLVYGTQNTPPEIKGATNKTIKVGDNFNALEGVTATDAEDLDLTSQIKVTGSVDTSKAGVYTLTYSVKDSAGEEVSVKRIITVEANTDVSVDANISVDPFVVYQDSYVKGTFTGDVAKIKLIVADAEYTGGTVNNNGTFQFDATNKIRNSYDKVIVEAYNAANQKVASKTVALTNGDGAGTILVNDYILGQSKYVEGAYQGNVSRVKLQVDDTEYAGGSVTGGKISFYAMDKIRTTTAKVVLVAYDKRGNKIAQQEVKVKPLLTGDITTNEFVVYQDGYVTGTFTGDVAKIKLVVEGDQGGEYAGGTVANGTFQFYAKDKIRSSYNKVTVKAFNSVGHEVASKEVPLKNLDGAGTINVGNYVLGESRYLEGTYTGNVSRVQLKVGDTVYSGGSVSDGKISFYAHGKIKNTAEKVTLLALDARGNLINQQIINVTSK